MSTEEVGKYFAQVLQDAPTHALSKLQSLCRLYDLSAEDLYAHWEACCIRESRSNDTFKLNDDTLAMLSDEVNKHAKRPKATKSSTAASGGDFLDTSFTFDENSLASMLQGGSFADTPMKRVRVNGITIKSTARANHLRSIPGSTNDTVKSLSTLAISTQNSKFADRDNRGTVEECYNEKLAKFAPTKPSSGPFSLTLLDAQQEGSYRYMFEKVAQKATVLDQLIEQHGSIISEAHQLTTWCHPGVPSQASSDAGQGARVRIRLDSLASFALFPGQIIGLQGVNNTGEHFMITKLYNMPPIALPKTPLTELREYHLGSQGIEHEPVGLIVAAGPYTLDDSLKFEPLVELLKKIEQNLPDLVILMGPFLDRQHPMMIHGQTDKMPEELFDEYILSPILDVLSRCSSTRIALVPATDDLMTDYLSLPQAPMNLSDLLSKRKSSIRSLSNQLFCWPNPPRRIAHAPTNTDRLARLASHLLEQRSFYPLYPPALGESVDMQRLEALAIHQQPDLLIIPSQLRHFCKTIGTESLCVNPGRLSRKQTGGTYARITVHPFSAELFYTTEANRRLTHKFAERTKVEIIRI
ncbi:DNA polymerase alpha subunit B N-terminal-domain-containing protein [Syncephalis fuscata]|nr:DNA polymerase alpha subunit B N-terminal-domain-containing protein [Syncephalis fuscata]